MDVHARRAAVRAYKERPPAWGVFAVICNATGQVWVGASRHVDTEQNGLWFSLRLGTGRCPSLQAAWSLHGEDAFRFEELERLREDHPPLTRPDELKRRSQLWRLKRAAILDRVPGDVKRGLDGVGGASVRPHPRSRCDI